MNTAQTINFENFPPERAERLAAGTLKAVKAFLNQPGGRETLDQQKLKRKEATERESKHG